LTNLEVIVCSVEDAVAAELGGADRLEVISHYEVGGLTPPVEMVRHIASKVSIPLRVMVRETEDFVVNDPYEVETLCERARAFAEIGVDGLVLGFLIHQENGKGIDHQLLTRIFGAAHGLKATFHRAFEELNDPIQVITELKRYGQIDRILTSGGENAWIDKVEDFAGWQRAAQPEIEIMVGGGTDAEVVKLLKPAGIREFHVGKAARAGQSIDGVVSAKLVEELAGLIRS